MTSSRDPREVNADWERAREGWRECENCDLHVPARTHHCGHCARCIYVLDHHCYFLGEIISQKCLWE